MSRDDGQHRAMPASTRRGPAPRAHGDPVRRPFASALLAALATTLVGLGPTSAQAPSAEPSPSAPSPAPTSLAAATAWLVDPVWSRLAVDGGPAAREDATWTVDADGHAAPTCSAVAPAGRSSTTCGASTSTIDAWSRLRPPGGPSARFGHSAAWVDEAGLVVFGGQRGTDFFDDLWAYDPERDRWTRAAAARTGSGRALRDLCDRRRGRPLRHQPRLHVQRPLRRHPRLRSRARALGLRSDPTAGDRASAACTTASSTRAGGSSSTAARTTEPGRSATCGCHTSIGGRGSPIRRRPPGGCTRSRRRGPTPGSSAARRATTGSSTTSGGSTVRRSRSRESAPQVRPRQRRSGAVMVADPFRQRILLFGGEARVALDDLWQLREASAIDAPGTTSEPSTEPSSEPTPGP